MKPNIELLNRTLEYIRTHPAEWDQGTWVCESSMCFAGRALALAGHNVEYGYTEEEKRTGSGALFSPTPVLNGQRCADWWHAGALALGISEFQADELFAPHNSFEDLERITCEIKLQFERRNEAEQAVIDEATRVIKNVTLKETAPL